MSENEFGKALLRSEDLIDAQALAAHVQSNERRRFWIIGVVCVQAWLLVVLLPWIAVTRAMASISQTIGRINGLSSGNGTGAIQQHQDLSFTVRALHGTANEAFLCSLLAMLLAAYCTLVLVFISRRATLRQLRAELAEISAQIRSLARLPK